MSTIEHKARLVVQNLRTKQEVPNATTLNPLLILTIISIIVNLIRIVQICRQTNAEVVDAMHNPGIFVRWRMSRVTRKALAKFPEFASCQKQVYNGVLAVAKGVTEDEVAQMLQEVDS